MLMDDPRMLRNDTRVASEPWFRRLSVKKVLSIEWLGQTVASACWICSVLAYGVQSAGDWLQLCAASAWLLANIAAVMAPKVD
ncbi:MAG: hypothetical protein ACR2N1_06460 [Rubripirellula sp.]|jgi:hypothetical protein